LNQPQPGIAVRAQQANVFIRHGEEHRVGRHENDVE
jgi:hypothetical protein